MAEQNSATRSHQPRTGTEVLESIESLLAQAAVTNIPVEPLRKRESEDLKELYKALGAAQKSFKDVEKSGLIGGRNIKYAKIDDLIAASRSALLDNNLVVSTFNVTYPGRGVTLVTRLYHYLSGQYIESELPLLDDQENQTRGSSITYSWRYTYAPLMGLVDSSYDDDGEITRPSSKR